MQNSNNGKKRIYFSVFDGVNFPRNRSQASGMNNRDDRMLHYMKAYDTLRAILEADNITAVFTLNQITDSQFFLRRVRFFKDADAIPAQCDEEPLEMLKRALREGKAVISTFPNGASATHTVSSYAAFSFERLKKKFDENPENNEFFLSSISDSLTYHVGAAPFVSDTGDKKKAPNGAVSARKHLCDFLKALMSRDPAEIGKEIKAEHRAELTELRGDPFNVYDFLAELRFKEPHKPEADNGKNAGRKTNCKNRFVYFSNKAIPGMGVLETIDYAEGILRLDDFCKAHPNVYEEQIPGVPLYAVARHFEQKARFVETCFESVPSLSCGSQRKEYAMPYLEKIIDLMDPADETQKKLNDRSAVYGLLEDSGIALDVFENVRKTKPWLNKNEQPSYKNNIIPLIRGVAVRYVNAMYNLQFAFKAECEYISEGFSRDPGGSGFQLTPIGKDKEGNPQWII